MDDTESPRDARASKLGWAGGLARNLRCLDWVLFPLLVGFVLACLGVLLYESANCGTKACTLLAVASWFDPVFFQYNLMLVLVAVIVVPGVTIAYVSTMARRKKGRLEDELDAAGMSSVRREELKKKIRDRIDRRLRLRAYFGSVLLATLIVFLGVSILLLFKPAFPPDRVGVDFTRGANVLTMGPYIDLLLGDAKTYYARLSWSLVAFQFGFLGAYLYFVGSLARAYFTLDLTPQTFVDGSIRMMFASVLALIVSFVPGLYRDSVSKVAPLPATASLGAGFDAAKERASADGAAVAATGTNAPGAPADAATTAAAAKTGDAPKMDVWPLSLAYLPIISFFCGFYPKRAMAFVERMVTAALRSQLTESYRTLPLAMLGGMSFNHEMRLETEGFDNVENLAHADALGLAVRTGLGYLQLRQWVGEAWLASHLRKDYADFVDRTGITSREELRVFFAPHASSELPAAIEQLASSTPEADRAGLKVKLASLAALIAALPIQE